MVDGAVVAIGEIVVAEVVGAVVVKTSDVDVVVGAVMQLFFASSPACSTLAAAADAADCATTCAMPSETSCASMMADTF